MTKPNKISRDFAQEVFDLVKSQGYTSLYQLDAKLLDEITYWHPSVMIEISEYLVGGNDMKKVVFVKEILLSDGDYCLTQDPASENFDTYNEDFISTKINQEAYILEELPEKDNQVFIYIPEFDYGAYMLKEFVKEAING